MIGGNIEPMKSLLAVLRKENIRDANHQSIHRLLFLFYSIYLGILPSPISYQKLFSSVGDIHICSRSNI